MKKGQKLNRAETIQRREKVKQLYEQGLTAIEIAKELNSYPEQIRTDLKILGIAIPIYKNKKFGNNIKKYDSLKQTVRNIISFEKAEKIRSYYVNNDVTYHELGKMFNVSKSCAYNIIKGRSIASNKFYIYHVPGQKIGCTNRYPQRCLEQGFLKFELLETCDTIEEASKRERELQKEHGYNIDSTPYSELIFDRTKYKTKFGLDTRNSMIDDRLAGMKFREIAEKNNCSISTVYTIINKYR